VLVLPKRLWERVVAHCLDGLPLEACGLLAGFNLPGGHGQGAHAQQDIGEMGLTGGLEEASGWNSAVVHAVFPAHNAARSARLYTVEPRDLLHADRAAEEAGLCLIGVWHSHTHTDAYPSPTDVSQAPDPAWHYVLVSLRDSEPVVRSFRIEGSFVTEERIIEGAA